MSEWNWPMVFVYAFVITALVVVIIGFSDAPVESERSFDSSSSGVEYYEPINRTVQVRFSESGMSPRSIHVGFMDTVVLRMRSVDGMQHRVTSGFGLNEVVGSDEVVFSFKADDLGFVFVRDGQGRPIGTIEVKESLSSSN